MSKAKWVLLLSTVMVAAPALAFDGWHIQNSTTIESKTATFDYIAYDEGTNRLFLGHRHEGLQVFDPVTHKVIKVIAKTETNSANGALLMSEFDLGIANNEDGTITPFKISTLEAQEPIKLGEELDTSHYDPATKRIFVNMASGADGTEVIVLEAPSLKRVGSVLIPSKKAEGADADGQGMFYLAEQDIDKIARIDAKTMKLVGEWAPAPCVAPTAIAVDAANKRVFVSCRGRDAAKPAFVVLNSETGAVVFSAEIGRGTDSLIYDAAMKRIFSANGITGNLSIIEQVNADTYKISETLATRPWAKVLAMDHRHQILYTMFADGTADASKKINVAVSPYYQNTVFPNTFTVLTITK